MYYDKKGEEITLEEYIKLSSDNQYKIIRQDTLADGTFISTVWLGLDHGFGGSPLIFETMVFKSRGDWEDKDMERYQTEAEAIYGHEKMVRKYKS